MVQWLEMFCEWWSSCKCVGETWQWCIVNVGLVDDGETLLLLRGWGMNFHEGGEVARQKSTLWGKDMMWAVDERCLQYEQRIREAGRDVVGIWCKWEVEVRWSDELLERSGCRGICYEVRVLKWARKDVNRWGIVWMWASCCEWRDWMERSCFNTGGWRAREAGAVSGEVSVKRGCECPCGGWWTEIRNCEHVWGMNKMKMLWKRVDKREALEKWKWIRGRHFDRGGGISGNQSDWKAENRTETHCWGR